MRAATNVRLSTDGEGNAGVIHEAPVDDAMPANEVPQQLQELIAPIETGLKSQVRALQARSLPAVSLSLVNSSAGACPRGQNLYPTRKVITRGRSGISDLMNWSDEIFVGP
jgi:hypothetical protein